MKASKTRPDAFPLKRREGDGGIDIATPDVLQLFKGMTSKIGIGWAFEMPEDWHLLALQKSRHTGWMIVQAPLIDNSYRGEVHCVVYALKDHIFHPGDYVMQLLPVYSPFMQLDIVDELSTTERGDGGFGSTGVQT